MLAGWQRGRERERPPRVAPEILARELRLSPRLPTVDRDLDGSNPSLARERDAADRGRSCQHGLTFATGRAHPRLHVHAPHRGLGRIALHPDPASAIDRLAVLDVVDAVEAGYHEAQRASVRERQRLASECPGEQRVVQRFLERDRSLDADDVLVHACGQRRDRIATRRGEQPGAGQRTARGLDHFRHAHAGPGDAACRAHAPLRSRRPMCEEATTVAGTLQHRGDALLTQLAQLRERERARPLHAPHLQLPRIRFGDDARGRQRQVVAHEQLRRGRDHLAPEHGSARLHRQRSARVDGEVRRDEPVGQAVPADRRDLERVAAVVRPPVSPWRVVTVAVTSHGPHREGPCSALGKAATRQHASQTSTAHASDQGAGFVADQVAPSSVMMRMSSRGGLSRRMKRMP
jgi:hypothetical protein